VLSAVLAAAAADEAAGAVPARWVTAAAGGAAAFAAGGRGGRPAVLALEVLRAMWMTKLRIGSVVVCGMLAAGAGLLVPSLSPGRSEPQEKSAQPPIDVTVVRPARRTTGEFQDYEGRTAASATVDVRSRITSQIEKVTFRPGTKVKRGDLLFELDARAFKPEADRAAAELQRGEVQLKGAQNHLTRVQKLIGTGSVDASEAERAASAVDEARAGLLAAKALWEKARLDLESTRITAPIDGQTGGTVLGIGNLTSPATTLVTIVAIDPIYVDFQVPESELPRLQKLLQGGSVTAHLGLSGDKDFSREGKIEFVDNQVNRNGTVRVRTSLANPESLILPGMFVRVRLMMGERGQELLIPQSAVRQTTNSEPFVLVARPDNVVEWRPVTIGPSRAGGQVVVHFGLRADDRVVIDAHLPAAGVSIRIREVGAEK
jgi:multidrug efflux system membrane fusion protein